MSEMTFRCGIKWIQEGFPHSTGTTTSMVIVKTIKEIKYAEVCYVTATMSLRRTTNIARGRADLGGTTINLLAGAGLTT